MQPKPFRLALLLAAGFLLRAPQAAAARAAAAEAQAV